VRISVALLIHACCASYKMKNLILIIASVLLIGKIGFSQSLENRKIRLPIWTFHQKNVSIYGVSLGAYSLVGDYRNTVTNGIRIEAPGLGFIGWIFGGSQLDRIDTITNGIKRKDFSFSEIVNGLNISSGSLGSINYNGLTLALGAQSGELLNGLSIVGLTSSFHKINGVCIGGILVNETLQLNGIQVSLGNSAVVMSGLQIGGVNEAKTMKGIQIGIVNKTYKSKGIQIGLWNINEHRKFPITNWNFKKQ
jgi:hypothetical protein